MTKTGPEKESGAQRRVAWKLHHNLINHLVDRQAATPEKALLELVMDAADAGATRVDIMISAGGFTIVDDGKGYPELSAEYIVDSIARTSNKGDAMEHAVGWAIVGC